TPPAFVLSQDQTLRRVFDCSKCLLTYRQFIVLSILKIDLHAIVLFSFQRTFFSAALRSDFIILPNQKL
ncbi:hypothetical protein, partial [Sutcliffiella cohnii]|uniref:hypothetical protein n=1 Tax=Sutcliffiella cohnii TaxID=33932 RepID=UPI002E202E58|nr:hypothetical protein [Sutcliffiella cohnii]